MDYEKLGTIGILLVAIVWGASFLKGLTKSHKESIEKLDELHRRERDTQNQAINKQFEQMNKDSVNATQALTELNTLVKQMKK